ncbi:MAG: alginate O-acetyltransferase, partial [Akkermansiaceae bacterium]|nr:alginate O-acetyltransferase [Akkermansiaceae bacterium]
MVFNTYTFLIFFLPLTLAGFLFLCGRKQPRASFGWLVFMSLVYYGWWDWHYLGLVIPLCTANYFLGKYLSRHQGLPRGKAVLTAGVTGNLLCLGYFKYSGFLGHVIQAASGHDMGWGYVILPLGISFFTFQKIAYLVDSYRGKTKDYKVLDFLLFVFFFPQLIAGPIVHHNEMMPQFASGSWNRKRWLNLAVGATILLIGLFKKVVIADNISPIANKFFDLAASGQRPLTIGEAWCAVLAYTAQTYFDFSGYTDMAIGAARL